MRTQPFQFTNPASQTLDARLETPTGRIAACALFAHCFTCSKNIAAATRISRALAERGVAVLRFDFTGLGGSDGEFANTSFSSNIADLTAAADALRTHQEAPTLLIGHSLGGAAVVAAAKHIPEVRGVITINAPSTADHIEHLFRDDLARIEDTGQATVHIAGRAFTIRREFLQDLRRHTVLEDARNLQQALLVLHSPADTVVNIDHARRLFDAARHPKSFVSLDDADHLLSRREDAVYVAEVVAVWAARYLEIDPASESDPDPRV